MSASLVNRSLNTIRTELDFLRESNVISEETLNEINKSLPEKYNSKSTPARESVDSEQLEYVEALYVFEQQQDGDLPLNVGDKVQILEKPSNEWYKGKCNGKIGMFPANYVKPAFSNVPQRQVANEPPQYQNDTKIQQQYTNNSSSTSSYPQQQQQAQFPPSSTSYYQQAPQQQPQQQLQQQPQQVVVEQPQQQNQSHDHLKKFGSKLGNAAIFGAGATLGSDLVNSIF